MASDVIIRLTGLVGVPSKCSGVAPAVVGRALGEQAKAFTAPRAAGCCYGTLSSYVRSCTETEVKLPVFVESLNWGSKLVRRIVLRTMHCRVQRGPSCQHHEHSKDSTQGPETLYST